MTEKIHNNWGTAAMVCGILSLVLCVMPYFALPLAILAVVFANKQKPKTSSAIAGTVTGIIGIVVNCITGIIAIAVLNSMMLL